MGKGREGRGRLRRGREKATPERIQLTIQVLPEDGPEVNKSLEDARLSYLEIVVRRWLKQKSLGSKQG